MQFFSQRWLQHVESVKKGRRSSSEYHLVQSLVMVVRIVDQRHLHESTQLATEANTKIHLVKRCRCRSCKLARGCKRHGLERLLRQHVPGVPHDPTWDGIRWTFGSWPHSRNLRINIAWLLGSLSNGPHFRSVLANEDVPRACIPQEHFCLFHHAFLRQQFRRSAQRQAAGSFRISKSQDLIKLRRRGQRGPRQGPRASQGRVADRLLHGDGEHAPPATGPCCSRRGPHAWWGAVRAEGDQAPNQHLRATALPPRNRGRIGFARHRPPVRGRWRACAVRRPSGQPHPPPLRQGGARRRGSKAKRGSRRSKGLRPAA